MLDYKQLHDFVAKPLLSQIKNGMSGIDAFMMCVAHESKGGTYLKQTHDGPAKGIIQMEPDTHNDVWRNGDSIWDNALKLGIIERWQYDIKTHPTSDRLIYDLRYNVFMFRQFMFMQPGVLPVRSRELAKYLKKYYNTEKGKATAESYYYDHINWLNNGTH